MGGGSIPPAPPAPDYGAANREGILADIETLPARRRLEAAARLGTAGTFELADKEGNLVEHQFDFTGVGDADLARNQAAIGAENARSQAEALLGIQQEFGEQFLTTARDQLKASDPIGFALREQLGQQITDDLSLGGQVSEQERERVSQSILSAQTARGNVRGVGPAVQEVFAQDQFARGLKQQRQQNAAAFLSGTTPLSQFGQLRSAQAGAAPFINPQIQGAFGLDPNAGAAAANFAQQTFGTQAQIYGNQLNYKAQQGSTLDSAMGIAGGLAGSFMMCWLAREVYGTEDGRWKKFRKWVLDHAPEKFREFYLRNGERLAGLVRGRDKLKARLRSWMDGKINEMETA